MNAPVSRTPMAGGALFAGSLLIGLIGGAFAGEPSIGFLAGAGVGLLLLVLVWLIDRRRR